ncbi:SusC/RagA family TonB-linked outer membrane protein [Riemerella columbipharyngis]|uniref:TonB-linked outer membrane protein, SusC/RagA family n=1 Tax=Riemerella columbipharyngis TaxID=1071918 RepID=A0A1G7C4P3_9FLAO|nr:SusC/RagA family TonB-linked outer membrane protein [Riemerella columbipharyngis]SDE34267.1 TonB-linked outer membrane protein, SusC/RagA family [Riemerella columbipharyngis]
MNVKLRVLAVGTVFFLGAQSVLAQKTKKDSVKTKDLDEVVMVGFGRKKAVQEITGATSVMKAKSIQDVPVTSVDKMLQGRVSGVQVGSASGQPGSSTIVRVRGLSSINGRVSPVYVVDGVRVSSGDLTSNTATANILSSLDPDSIESITILKDAVSTAVYGADAGAGVIVITTKQGKKGKAKFNLGMSRGVSFRAVDGYRALTTPQYKQYLFDAIKNGYNEATATNYINNRFDDTYNTDWRAVTERTSGASVSNINLSASGGTDRLQYYVSGNYFDQDGVVKNSSFSRFSFNSKVDYQATDKLKLSSSTQMAYSKQSSLAGGAAFSNPILQQYFLLPTDPVRNPDGTYFGLEDNQVSNGLYNPAALLEYNSIKTGTAKVFANFSAEYSILKNLRYKLVFAPEYINIEENNYASPLHGDGFANRGQARAAYTRYFNYNVQNILSYSANAGLNNFDITAIQEAYQSQYYYLSGFAQNVGALGLETLSNFVKPVSIDNTKSTSSRNGYALTGHYDYDRLVLLDLSYRRDILSNFVPGKKGGNFWSAGLGIDLARLPYFKNIRSVSMLKFRSSYGRVGNEVSTLPYALYGFTNSYNSKPAITYSGVYNPNLTWETVSPFNIGLDFGFFDNRFTLSAEYYHKKTDNLIYNIPLSPSQGLTSYFNNIGSLVNKGFEISFNADIFKNGRDGFNWSIGGNFNTLDNKVTQLYGGAVRGSSTILKEGESVGTYYLRKWAGVDPDNGNPLWYKNGVDGETTSNYGEAQQAVQGARFNKYFGGVNTTLSYKGFSIDAQATYGFGGKIYNGAWGRYFLSDGAFLHAPYSGYSDAMDYWTPENRNAQNPKPVYRNESLSNEHSTRYLFKSDYIRLSTAKLAYTFDRSLIEKSGLSSLQIYLSGTNILTYRFDKKLKLDPEIGLAGTADLDLPIMKTYSLGVNIGF